MKNFFNRGLFIVLIVLVPAALAIGQGLPQIDPEKVGISKKKLDQADRYVQSLIDEKKLAGSVILIARNGKTAHIKSFGVMDTKPAKPMKNDTIFRIASMSKAITSAAVMILVDEGKLSIDDPVSKYIPEFAKPKVLIENDFDSLDEKPYQVFPAGRQITVRHLLTHTSGITYRFWEMDFFEEIYREAGISDGLTQTEGTIGDMVKKLAALPLVFTPGERWMYGLSTDVLGYLVEVVSGMPFDRFLADRVFGPLEMADTCFFLPEDKVSRFSALFEPVKGGGLRKVGEAPKRLGASRYSASFHYKGPRTHFSGGGGLASTAGDYARFLQMILNSGELDGVRVLKPESATLMTTNQIGDMLTFVRTKHGLGFGVSADRKTGATKAFYWGGYFYTKYWVDPGTGMIVIMMNQLFPNFGVDYADRFRALAFESLVK